MLPILKVARTGIPVRRVTEWRLFSTDAAGGIFTVAPDRTYYLAEFVPVWSQTEFLGRSVGTSFYA